MSPRRKRPATQPARSRRLQLDRPIVFFDVEATGPNPETDRIVEIAAVRLEPGGGREAFETRVKPVEADGRVVPIPPQATAVHGISDADVADAPTFAQIAPRLVLFFAGADVGGYNVRKFDLPILDREFRRADPNGGWSWCDRRVVDAMAIFHRKEPRSLAAALRFYCGRDLVGAHEALADVEATIDVLEGQLRRYDDLPDDVAGLHDLCRRGPRGEEPVDAEGKFVWLDGEAAFAFGKHQTKTLRAVAETDPSYLKFVLERDFSPEVKRLVAEALKGRFPQR